MGGLERYIANISSYICGRDPDFHFMVLTDRSFVPFSRLGEFPKRQDVRDIGVLRLGPNSMSFVKGIFFKLFHLNSDFLDKLYKIRLYREAIGLEEVKNIDVFHVHGGWLNQYPTIGLWLSQHFRRPLIVSLHGDSVNAQDGSMQINTPEMLRLLRQADVIVTYSRNISGFLKELGFAAKCLLVPNFVDVKRFSRPARIASGDGTRIVVVSRLDAFKDPLTIIRAFESVKREVPEAKLTVVGDGPLFIQTKELLKELGLQGSVSLVGRKDDVREFLWSADVFVATNAGYIAALEAWSAGVAVVAPSIGILEEIMHNNENALLVPNNDEEQLSNAMIRLMKDKELRRSLVNRGLKAVQEYDIGLIAPRIATIYSALSSKNVG